MNKQLAEKPCCLAPQNLLADAPFSKLDLVSCRNLLIYLEPEVQQKLLQLFHFAPQRGGYLNPPAPPIQHRPADRTLSAGLSQEVGASFHRLVHKEQLPVRLSGSGRHADEPRCQPQRRLPVSGPA